MTLAAEYTRGLRLLCDNSKSACAFEAFTFRDMDDLPRPWEGRAHKVCSRKL